MGWFKAVVSGIKNVVHSVEGEAHKVEDFKLPTVHTESEIDASKLPKQLLPIGIFAVIAIIIISIIRRR